MFKKKTISYYEKALLEGSAHLVINPLNGKYTADDTDGGCDYYLVFNASHRHIVDASPRNSYHRYQHKCNWSVYKKATEGQSYYLVLKPEKKRPERMDVVAVFPVESTVLPPSLQVVVQRDEAYTALFYPYEEAKEEATQLLNEQFQKLADQPNNKLFSKLGKKFITKFTLWVLCPLFGLGLIASIVSVILVPSLFLAALMFLGVLLLSCCGLLMLAVLIFLILHKPLIARKLKKMEMETPQ